MNNLGFYLTFYVTILVAIALTILICRYRDLRKRPVSFVPVFASPVVSALIVALCLGFYYDGWDVFTPSYWTDAKGGFAVVLFSFMAIAVPCILPSLAVVLFYKARGKNAESNTCR
jgi:cytochrome c biogenesis protein CcdA